MTARSRRRLLTPLRAAVLAVVLAVAACPAWIGYQVWSQSVTDEVGGADAIVVLGAAQYDGEPSPVFRGRLDHAVYLYDEDLSDVVIVTGGKQAGDRFTEAEAGAAYLVERGVPGDAILRENEGATTLESLQNVRAIADRYGIGSLLVVSDPMHSERVKRMAADLGFDPVYASWVSYQDVNRSRETKARELVREVASIIVYELFDR